MKKNLMTLIIVVIIAAVAISVLLGKIEKLEMENAALLEQLAATQALLEAAQTERDDYAAQLTALETQHTVLQTEYDTVFAEKESLTAELATLNTAYTAAQASVAELEGYKALATELEAKLAEAATRAETLLTENADLLAQIEAAKLSIAANEDEITQLKGRFAILRELMKKN